MVRHIASKKNLTLSQPILSHPHIEKYFRQIQGDENRFLQVIINFLSNSIKFSKTDSEIKIYLTLNQQHQLNVQDFQTLQEEQEEVENNQVQLKRHLTNYIKFSISIEDFGVGIPPEKLKSLFIDFSTLNESSQLNPNGRGLGLSICKSIVESMSGSVDV